MTPDNNIIMADNIKIVRINNTNEIVFDVSHGRNSSPISPVLTSNGYIVLGLDNGEVVTNQVDNSPAGIKVLGLGSPTKNTPCVNGNSVFLSTDAGLKKVNISGDGTPSLEWTFDGVIGKKISKSGGASPLFLNGFVYFDAKSGLTFKLYKVNANDKSLGFVKILPVRIPASVAQSPVNSTMWYFPFGGKLKHINENGDDLGGISNSELGGVPSSAITMASNNVLIVGSGIGPNAAVTAINLNTEKKLWRVGAGQLDTFGQFAIMNQKVFCTTRDQRLFKLS